MIDLHGLIADESDRLNRIARVIQSAEQIFASAEKAQAWLKNANSALQGAIPLELLATDEGAERVAQELIRIDYGDLY